MVNSSRLSASVVGLAAVLAFIAPPAGASLSVNGLNLNSLTLNALNTNAITTNALAGNALTHNSLAQNGILHNALNNNGLANNSLIQNAVTSNGIAVTSSVVEELNGVAVEAVLLPDQPFH